MYITYDDYVALYGEDRIPESDFDRINFKVQRTLDQYTTGIDNVKKLREAFPEDEEDAANVKACGCCLADVFYQIEQVGAVALEAYKGEETANGRKGGVISSMSAGNESISYATGGGETLVEKASADVQARQLFLADTVRAYLSGVTDKNGVNLLYMGRYPRG